MSDLGNKEILAQNLQYYMKINNKDRNDIARDLDIPYTTITSWLKAEFYPRIDKIEMLANYFEIKKSDLVEKKSDKVETSPSSAIVFVYGTIPAGVPMECIEDIIDTEEIPTNMLKGGKQFFGLKIKGNSMFPTYLDNDTVIFEKADVCESGQDCVVMVNGNDGTFKRVITNGTGIILQPLNPEYEPMAFSSEQIANLPIRIIGIAREIRRKL